MQNQKTIKLIIFGLFLIIFSVNCFAQNTNLLKRTVYKSDKLDFGAGGTVSVIGAPNGSIEIEGWQKNEVEISAEIEIQAANEADLATLAEINNFVLEESMGHLSIISVGTHDKQYLKRVAKKFPKNLLGLPFRIDYKLKVPAFCDLEIDGGSGDFNLSKVDGTMKINYINSNAKLALVGGMMTATFGAGTVDISIPTRGWRGRFADIQLAKGDMNVQLPVSLNAEITASILSSGKIENLYNYLKPRARKDKFTEQSIVAKSGNGGVTLNFTVGSGNMKLAELKKSE
jgi:Putative adhesin